MELVGIVYIGIIMTNLVSLAVGEMIKNTE